MKTGEFHNPARKVAGQMIWHYDVVASTNETLKELLDEDVPEGLVIWADRQASGKGRHGRAWASPPGGLYLSILLRPKQVHAQILGLLAGIPLIKTLRHFGVFAALKWPNDAIFQGRKLAGILSEGVYRGDAYHVILGVGINTNMDLERLPPDVQKRATSLKREVNLFVANEECLEYFLEQIDDVYSRYLHTPAPLMMKEYRGACGTIGKRVSVETPQGKVVGKAFDIAPTGALLVLDDHEVRHEIVDGSVEYVA
ncbi:MAG TPA: biotin--[acetyl-CoA-carboxylase] ligase [Thermoplasmata archaeon]|nr:biotin--[acetyl-CoA-carboxylase] ligase [Thermoplasmata archaeon]